MNLDKLQDFISKQPFVWMVGVLLIVVILVLIFTSPKDKGVVSSTDKLNASKDIGISVGGAEQQAYLARLEKNYYDFEDRIKDVETQLKNIQGTTSRLENSQEEIAQSVLKIDQGISIKLDQRFDQFKELLESSSMSAKAEIQQQEIELSVATINAMAEKDWVYLPIGSFCQGTLLTGVYATADANNPLPVLISLDEAFHGPNKTRIPLKGAFVIGKAYGDLTSQRALIQIVAISSVLPDGQAFEHERELGYVTDEFGQLGIQGQVIYNTGRQLALSFMGGFVAGGSQALADGEVTTRRDAQGSISRDVTGHSGRNALFSGLAQSSGKLAEYYQNQAQEMIPAVHIKNGAKVFFIVQKGVTINGLSQTRFDYQHFLD